jgi:hypothetical protein
VLLGVALAGEAFGLSQGIGLALVLGGVALGSLPSMSGIRRSRVRKTAARGIRRSNLPDMSRVPEVPAVTRPITAQLALAVPRR